MRTLLITSSFDATSDLLIGKLGSDKFIRLNYDRPRDWVLKLTINDIQISSTHGIFHAEDIAKFIWRKPFISKTDDPIFNEDFVGEEWKYALYEIALLMQDLGKLRMNFPISDFQLGKIKQQRYAESVFSISQAGLYLNSTPPTDRPTIVKSLSSKNFSNGKVLYTMDVSGKELSPDLWYVQDRVKSNFDLTCVYVYGKIFSFRLDRSKLSSVDWRRDQFEIAEDWEKVTLNEDFNRRLDAYMKKLGLVYGRLDFLQNDLASEPIFLEVNKNGQWAWLDPHFENGLFSSMCDVFDPAKP
jgi:hypothetical protein